MSRQINSVQLFTNKRLPGSIVKYQNAIGMLVYDGNFYHVVSLEDGCYMVSAPTIEDFSKDVTVIGHCKITLEPQ